MVSVRYSILRSRDNWKSCPPIPFPGSCGQWDTPALPAPHKPFAPLDVAPGESFHIPLHCLHKELSCFGCKGQNCFGLGLPEVEVGHAFAVVPEQQTNAPLLRVESYVMGQSFSSCFSGMIVATLPLFSHTCLRAISEPLESIPYGPALLWPMSPCSSFFKFERSSG